MDKKDRQEFKKLFTYLPQSSNLSMLVSNLDKCIAHNQILISNLIAHNQNLKLERNRLNSLNQNQ